MTAAGDPKQGQGPTKGNSSPQRDNRQPTQGPRGFSDLGKIPVKPLPGRGWVKLVHPKGSWVPDKLFPSQKILANLAGDQSLHRAIFSGPILGPQKAPRPLGTQTWTWGSKNGVWGQKYQSCVLKNHAESTGRCSNQGHMLQVMTQNRFGVGGSNWRG